MAKSNGRIPTLAWCVALPHLSPLRARIACHPYNPTGLRVNDNRQRSRSFDLLDRAPEHPSDYDTGGTMATKQSGYSLASLVSALLSSPKKPTLREKPTDLAAILKARALRVKRPKPR